MCQTRGADLLTALACAALLAGLEPYPGAEHVARVKAERAARSHRESGDQAHP
jgi:hypothetical protein